MRWEVIPFITPVSTGVFSEEIRWKVVVLQAVVRADFICGGLGLFPGRWLRTFGKNGTGKNHPRCIMFFSQYFGFPLSVSFHHFTLIFIYMLLLRGTNERSLWTFRRLESIWLEQCFHLVFNTQQHWRTNEEHEITEPTCRSLYINCTDRQTDRHICPTCCLHVDWTWLLLSRTAQPTRQTSWRHAILTPSRHTWLSVSQWQLWLSTDVH